MHFKLAFWSLRLVMCQTMEEWHNFWDWLEGHSMSGSLHPFPFFFQVDSTSIGIFPDTLSRAAIASLYFWTQLRHSAIQFYRLIQKIALFLSGSLSALITTHPNIKLVFLSYLSPLQSLFLPLLLSPSCTLPTSRSRAIDCYRAGKLLKAGAQR